MPNPDHRIDALERRIAKLEAQSQPLGKTCPECHAFGLESYVLRTAFNGHGLQMVKCRFCAFAEEKMPSSASSLPVGYAQGAPSGDRH